MSWNHAHDPYDAPLEEDDLWWEDGDPEEEERIRRALRREHNKRRLLDDDNDPADKLIAADPAAFEMFLDTYDEEEETN